MDIRIVITGARRFFFFSPNAEGTTEHYDSHRKNITRKLATIVMIWNVSIGSLSLLQRSLSALKVLYDFREAFQTSYLTDW